MEPWPWSLDERTRDGLAPQTAELLKTQYGRSARDYAPDWTFAYNTAIEDPAEYGRFLSWADANGLDPMRDAFDYDLQGAYLKEAAMPLDERVAQALDPRGHGSDEFKKPNHSTMSVLSKYSSPLHPGGIWTDGAFLMPPAGTPNFMGNRGLASYMLEAEPGAALYNQLDVLPRQMYPDYRSR